MENLIANEKMNYFWKKRDFVYYALSILIFMIHISSFAQYTMQEGTMSLINDKMAFFFKESITRFAVPLFFILSGATFFRDYTNKKYISKIKSRFFTLIIPFLVWNTIWMIFDIICSYTFISSFFTGRKIFTLTAGNVFKSIFLAEWNIPFWFLFYLIIFVFISPIIDFVIRNKYAGIASVAIMSIISIFEIGSLKYDAIAFYLLGAFLGKHYFDFVTRKTSIKSGMLSIIFLTVYIVAKNLFPQSEYFAKPFVKIIIFMLASYSFWSVVDLFMDKIAHRPVYTRSFSVFVLHSNISSIICKVFYLIFPKNEYLAFPNFIVTIILTLIIINVICYIAERYVPRIYALLMGRGIKSR